MGKAVSETSMLPLHCVDVVESGEAPRPHRVGCEIGRDLRFDTTGLEAYCFANWDARVFDAFALAAAVQFCDHTRARSSVRWGREIKLRMPVHDSAHWSSTAVSETLHAALEFLTGDRWHIRFVARKRTEQAPRQRNLALPDGSCVIIPYSDGLDSLAVAGLLEREYRHKLIRVRLGSRSLGKRKPESKRIPFAAVPYHVRYREKRAVESSARTRGFKFTLLSGIAAYLSDASEVVVPESGQGALGPVLVPVGQAYEDYRSHPLFTDLMEAFLLALFGHKVRYMYPRLWHTKAETLAAFIAAYPNNDSWTRTRSCWQGPRQVSVSQQLRQCGICAACLLRRMSVHAMGASEVKAAYVWEDLSAPCFEKGVAEEFGKVKPQGALYEHAIAGVLHLDHLADLSHSSTNRVPLERQVFRLSRSISLSEQETRLRLERLLAQHGREWTRFVESLGAASFVAQWAMGRP